MDRSEWGATGDAHADQQGLSPTDPAPELVEAGFALEIADAPLLHADMSLADIAHVLVLREADVAPDEPSRRLLGQILEAYRTPAERFPYDPRHGEVYNCRERFFTQRLGVDAGWLHAGRPRREAARVAFRLLLRRAVAALVADIAAFAGAVADLAEAHAETLMPDQTYLQQAQPSTFGHYVLHFAYPALRAGERLLADLATVNQSPGGAGCVNGSRLTLDRGLLASLLGFDDVIEHTRDAMWQSDSLIELVSTAASHTTSLSKLAEDLEIWNSQEFDFVALAGPYTRASVLMPQKRNPYSLTIVRGMAGVLVGRVTGLLAVTKTPSARSDNFIFAYGEVPRALEMAARATRLMRGVVATLEVRAQRMREALLQGFSQATDLAEHVMLTCGIDYRSAYLVVGDTVRRASREGLRGVDITGEMIDEAAEARLGRRLGLTEHDLGEVLDPGAIVASRSLPGGAAPDMVRTMAASCRKRAVDLGAEAAARSDAFARAERDLVTAAERVARP